MNAAIPIAAVLAVRHILFLLIYDPFLCSLKRDICKNLVFRRRS